jgi:DNA-binding response OmpR family regulator
METQAGRILIVEDVSVIAMSLADVLRDEGFEIVGPVGSEARALTLLDEGAVDAVVLDPTLQDSLCIGLAATLRARRVPFVIYSGHRPDSVDMPEFRDVPWIEKPCTITEITTALSAVLRLSPRAGKGTLDPAPACVPASSLDAL